MNLLAALVLATATARVEAVTPHHRRLAARGARGRSPAEPGMVAVHREGAGARVSIADAELGGQFAGGSRFAWTPPTASTPPCSRPPPDSIGSRWRRPPSEVSVLLRVPPEVSIDVRRDSRGLLLVFREESAAIESPVVASAAPDDRRPRHRRLPSRLPSRRIGGAHGSASDPAIAPVPRRPRRRQPRLRRPVEAELTTTAAVEAPDPARASCRLRHRPIAAARRRRAEPLTPAARHRPRLARHRRAREEPLPGRRRRRGRARLRPGRDRPRWTSSTRSCSPGARRRPRPRPSSPRSSRWATAPGVPFGPFRVRAGVDVRYVDADTYIEGPDSQARDRYLEVVPRIAAEAPRRRRTLSARVHAGPPRLRHLRRGQHHQPPRERRDRPARRSERDPQPEGLLRERGPRHARGRSRGRVLLRPRALPPEHPRRRAEHPASARA